MATVEHKQDFERHLEVIVCHCGGAAEQVETTPEERRKYGCGRAECCDRAFVCKVCGDRIVGSADAPEDIWDDWSED